MGFLDTFKGKQYKAEAEQLSRQMEHMQSMLTPEMQDVVTLKNEADHLNQQVFQLREELDNLNRVIDKKKTAFDCD